MKFFAASRTPQTPSGFRTDINALRAIAVLAVTLFHFQVAGFQGGYVGVDIFFVISGFLMTKIIIEKTAANQFSLGGFLWSRLIRIYPPMLALLFILLALGYFFISPDGYQVLARRSLYALASLSNWCFYREALDYFASEQKSNWLLHLWSLAVEVQFYLIYPILLWWAQLKKREGSLIWLLFIVSLAAGILFTRHHQSAAFFLLPTRMWEFLAGGLALLYGKKFSTRQAHGAAITGFILLGVSIVTYRDTMMFPGWLALLPVSGTALIIAARREYGVLNMRPVQFLGTVSYSVYLWHWPVWVAAQYWRVPLDGTSIALMILASLVLGTLSYRMIETPANHLRHRRGAKHWPSLMIMVAALALTGVFAGLIISHKGFDQRAPELIRDVIPRFAKDNATQMRSSVCFLTLGLGPKDFKENCFAPPHINTHPVWFVWGDSYAAHVWIGMDSNPRFADKTLRGATSAGCLPFLQAPSAFNKDCTANNERAMTAITQLKPDHLVLFANWSYAADNGVDVAAKLVETAQFYAAKQMHVTVIGPNPEWQPALPQRLLQESMRHGGVIPERLSDPSQQKIRALDEKMAAAMQAAQIPYVSLVSLWCGKKDCATLITRAQRRELIDYDFGHMTVPAAQHVADQLLDLK